MKTWTVRLGLSLMVAVGLWTNRAPAQERVMPPAHEYGVPPKDCVMPPLQIVVVPTVPFIPDYRPVYPPPLYPPPPPCLAKHAVVRTLNHFGMGCQADSFSSVGSFQSEFRWAFGSSRTFFGDRCIPCGQPGADGRNP
jgi:hypothetical protein